MADADHTLTHTRLKGIRADLRKQDDLLVQLVDVARRHSKRFEDMDRRFGDVERRITDTTADLELMLKGELLGRLTNFEIRIDERLAEIEDRNKADAG